MQLHIDLVINIHNAQVSDFQRIQKGIITVADNNDYINRSSVDYLTTWEVLNTRLLDTYGGYLWVRCEIENGHEVCYLDYLNDFSVIPKQKLEFGDNIIDISQKGTAEDTITGIIPLGAKIEGTDERLNIKSVNNGKDYLINVEAQHNYGNTLKFEAKVWDDVTLPQNLKTKAMEYLNNIGVKLSKTIEITALDRFLKGEAIESLFIGDYVTISSTPHGISANYLVRKLNLPLQKPQESKITVGDTVLTLTEESAKATRKIKDGVSKIEAKSIELKQSLTTLTSQVDDIQVEVSEAFLTAHPVGSIILRRF